MKKQALLLMAGGLMSLASCTTETHESDMSQTQIDSTVNARVEEIRVEMMRQNDSLINAMAQIKADSIIAAMKGGKSVTTKTTTTRTTTGKPSVTTSGNANTSTGASSSTGSSNPKDARFNGGASNTDKKDARFNEDAARKQQEAGAKKKEERFK